MLNAVNASAVDNDEVVEFDGLQRFPLTILYIRDQKKKEWETEKKKR